MRHFLNMHYGTAKKIKVAVVCEDSKSKEANRNHFYLYFKRKVGTGKARTMDANSNNARTANHQGNKPIHESGIKQERHKRQLEWRRQILVPCFVVSVFPLYLHINGIQ